MFFFLDQDCCFCCFLVVFVVILKWYSLSPLRGLEERRKNRFGGNLFFFLSFFSYFVFLFSVFASFSSETSIDWLIVFPLFSFGSQNIVVIVCIPLFSFFLILWGYFSSNSLVGFLDVVFGFILFLISFAVEGSFCRKSTVYIFWYK